MMATRSRVLLLLGVILSMSACRGPRYGATTRLHGRSEVLFVGGLHQTHRTSVDYPLRRIASMLRNARPDAIFVQAPPSLLEELKAASRTHRWNRSLPDVGVAIAYGLANALPIEAISGFNGESARRWARYRARFPAGPEDADYRRVRAYFNLRSAREGADSPAWVGSPLYARLSAYVDRTRWRALERIGAMDLADDWSAHVELFRDALSRHRGKRIAVVFDARRRWLLEDALPRDVSLLDARAIVTRTD